MNPTQMQKVVFNLTVLVFDICFKRLFIGKRNRLFGKIVVENLGMEFIKL